MAFTPGTEVGRMPYAWPEDTDFALWELDVLDRNCSVCGRRTSICDHRYRRVHTLEGPVELVCKLNHCPDPTCPGHAKTKSPELEVTIALPKWAIGWDVFCWIGHRRCSRHRSIPQIQSDLRDDYCLVLRKTMSCSCTLLIMDSNVHDGCHSNFDKFVGSGSQ